MKKSVFFASHSSKIIEFSEDKTQEILGARENNLKSIDLSIPLNALLDIIGTKNILFAFEQGTNYKMLKYFNPWLRSNSLTVSAGKSYDIKVPTGKFAKTHKPMRSKE